MAIQIQVKLDTSANPPVTMVPNQPSVNRGNNTIEWTPFAQESFTFVSLTGLSANPPFSGLTVTSSKITIQDDNSATGDYPYSIMVLYNGMEYSSESSVHAGHRASAGGVRAHAALGGSNSPTIKNN
jgi:hypothetical protein